MNMSGADPVSSMVKCHVMHILHNMMYHQCKFRLLKKFKLLSLNLYFQVNCTSMLQEINVCIVLIAFIASGIMHVLVVLGFKRGPNQPLLPPVCRGGVLTLLLCIRL